MPFIHILDLDRSIVENNIELDVKFAGRNLIAQESYFVEGT